MKTTFKSIWIAGILLLFTTNSFAQFYCRIGPFFPRGVIIGATIPPPLPPARIWIQGHWGWNYRLHYNIWIPGHWFYSGHRKFHP